MNRKRLGLTALAAAALFVLALTTPALAQTGMLKGKVLDAQGAPVEGAKVTIAQKGMKNSREVKTNKKGEWVQIGLFPGEYTITAEKGEMKGSTDTRVSVGENPELTTKIGAAGPSPELAAKAAALQKVFDEGVAASKAGDYDTAIAKFTDAAGQAPACADCYYNIGYAHSAKKEWDKAEAAYKKATEIRPDYSEAWNGLANAYNSQKKLDLALEASANAAKYGGGGAAGGGGSANALYNQGVILFNQGKYPEAKEKFAAAIKADPTYGDGYYQLAMTSLNTGDLPGAVEALEGYLKVAPNGPHAEKVKGFLKDLKK